MNTSHKEDLQALIELIFEAEPRLESNLKVQVTYFNHKSSVYSAVQIRSLKSNIILAVITRRDDYFHWEQGSMIIRGILIEDMGVMTDVGSRVIRI
jgi:hypothetical protein